MDGGDGHEIWVSFIQAKYLKDAVTYLGKCPTCKSPKDCQNYYCPLCKVGGLCPISFRGGGEHHRHPWLVAGAVHHRHPWLQVRRQSFQSAVDPVELAKFIGKHSADHIQTAKLNGKTLCYLSRTRVQELNGNPTLQGSSSKHARRQRVSRHKMCLGCKYLMVNSQESNLNGKLKESKKACLVCCLQCLITAAQREPGRNLLQLVDGALNLTDKFPRTAIEKTSRSLKSVNSGALDMEAMLEALDIIEVDDREPVELDGGSCSRRADRANSPEVHGGECDPACASGNSVPDYSGFSNDYLCLGLQHLMQAIAAKGDWERYLGDIGKD